MEVTRCWLETGRFFVVFCEVALRVVEALGVKSSPGPNTQVLEPGQNGNVVTRKRASESYTNVHESLRQGL